MIKILRLLSHEEVLCDATETDTGWIIKEPMLIVPTETGIGLRSFMPYTNIESVGITINKNHVLFDTEPQPELLEKYKELFSKIFTQPSKIIL
tara:strand:+ start:1053 stop:1331 length:279 start_codon:yes stop_codon:yes gene_type:complete